MTPLNLLKTNQNLLERGPGAAPGRPGDAPGGPGLGPGQGSCISLGLLCFRGISELLFLLTVSLDSSLTVEGAQRHAPNHKGPYKDLIGTL